MDATSTCQGKQSMELKKFTRVEENLIPSLVIVYLLFKLVLKQPSLKSFCPSSRLDVDLNQLKKSFGSSNEFIKSIYKDYKPSTSREEKVSDALQKEIQLLASCSYDTDTEWGTKASCYCLILKENYVQL